MKKNKIMILTYFIFIVSTFSLSTIAGVEYDWQTPDGCYDYDSKWYWFHKYDLYINQAIGWGYDGGSDPNWLSLLYFEAYSNDANIEIFYVVRIFYGSAVVAYSSGYLDYLPTADPSPYLIHYSPDQVKWTMDGSIFVSVELEMYKNSYLLLEVFSYTDTVYVG